MASTGSPIVGVRGVLGVILITWLNKGSFFKSKTVLENILAGRAAL